MNDIDIQSPFEPSGPADTVSASPGDAGEFAATAPANPHEHPHEQVQKRSQDTEIIDRLAALIETPFIDNLGRVYCRVPTKDGNHGIVLPLRDHRVKCVLSYQYRLEHGCHPGVARTNAALDYVEGQQVTRMRSNASIYECPTWRCFRILFEEEPSGSGSAQEILNKLRGIEKNKKILRGAESLPDSASILGKWLSQHLATLRYFGIELSRPTRLAQKRLWAWQAMTPDDGSDTSLLHPSVREKHQNTECTKQNDTMSDTEMSDLLKGMINDTDF